ncbi:hypothetical protein [Halomarina rubra]|uniref:Uncharacterized protein n=1 Tax=Halomarina rubra TaxID=2071873 RepID=A0ABD6ASC5_9EURY|nr:hypothetical protein [Halomarina rubra]
MNIDYPGAAAAVTIATGTTLAVEDGAVDVPDEHAERVIERFTERYGVTYDDEGNLVDADSGDEVAETDAVDPAAATDGTLGDLEDALATGEYDDILDEVAAAEKAGDDRDGAYERIDDRRTELEA